MQIFLEENVFLYKKEHIIVVYTLHWPNYCTLLRVANSASPKFTTVCWQAPDSS